jgi:hypothetical protein
LRLNPIKNLELWYATRDETPGGVLWKGETAGAFKGATAFCAWFSPKMNALSVFPTQASSKSIVEPIDEYLRWQPIV